MFLWRPTSLLSGEIAEVLRLRGDTALRLNDWFCGAGGATQGAHSVPGVQPILAANHDQMAIDTHSANFPTVEHFRGDIKDLDVAKHPYAEIFWASPECTNWSKARGNPVDFDKEPALFGDPDVAVDVARSRALMQDVIRYLEGMHLRQRPVLAGVVENVVDIRRWVLWPDWRRRIEGLGYRTRLIALNSMHAQPRMTPFAPQSRDRLYLAYWHQSIGRDPEWDRWLRPLAHCPSCDQDVSAVQSWKQPGAEMGRYKQQYLYRCPSVACRGQVVEPYFVPALAAIDWSLPGQRIGDREKPLADKTRARIAAGIARYWRPLHIEAGGHTYDAADPKHAQHGNPNSYYRAWPVDAEAFKTFHTIESKALVVPVEGRTGSSRNQQRGPCGPKTARNETGIAWPFVAELRGGGSFARRITEPVATITASGNHHALVSPYYGNADTAKPIDEPLGTLTTRDRYALVMRNNGSKGAGAEMLTPVHEYLRTLTTAGHQSLVTPGDLEAAQAMVDDCLFRMFEPHEIHAGMAFVPEYIVLGNKRQQVKQLGNAVTPPVAEVLVSALVECIQGHAIDWPVQAVAA